VDFFQERDVQEIVRLLASYAEAPANREVLQQLEAMQQGVMAYVAGVEIEKLEPLFNGNLGVVFWLLQKSGLSDVPAEKARLQCQVLDETISKSLVAGGAPDLRALLARILCSPAHRTAVLVAPERIPAWFRTPYMDYVIAPPPVFLYAGEAELFHDHLLTVARAVHELILRAPRDPVTNAIATAFVIKANYIPLYCSGRNTLEHVKLRAAIMEYFLSIHGAAIDFSPPARPERWRKIKVGVISSHFGHQTETYVTLPILQIDRNRFEICLFPVLRNPGPVEDYCRTFANSFTPLPQNLDEQVRLIRAANLDIAIIGSNVTAVSNAVSLIALHRLAPLQLVNYCSPTSTGMRHVDGYLSGTLMDRPGLAEEFSEKLYFTEGPPGCHDYTVENKDIPETFDRKSLGWDDEDFVFVNAAACFKILPEMLETWAKILHAVPRSRLLLMPFNPNWNDRFPAKQFERVLIDTFDRFGLNRDRFQLAGSLPSRAAVKDFLGVADVYLDTFPFSGSIAVIDPLEIGLPTVVSEGRTHRGRAASAMLRELGLHDAVAHDESSYVALATRLGKDPALRRDFGVRILAGMAANPVFVNARSYARRLGDLLESIALPDKRRRTA
jgi:predicted O-linked N-acetylglucosamine transferase (SPINDLY family)